MGWALKIQNSIKLPNYKLNDLTV